MVFPGEGGVSPSLCASLFSSLCQRISSLRKLAVSQLQCWAEDEGWAAATFPRLGGRKEPTGCLFFSHVG